LVKIKQNHHNEAVADLVLNRNEMKKIVEYDGKLNQERCSGISDSGFCNGRSQFFAAGKIVGNLEIDTILFNILVLWLMTLFLYIALVNDWLRKLLSRFKSVKREG
jgi:ABC transport system ATP-binding/permease protein